LEPPASLADDGWRLCTGLQDRVVRQPRQTRGSPAHSHHKIVGRQKSDAIIGAPVSA